jgi:hypothetical protein
VVPSPAVIEMQLSRLVGQCDLMFRTRGRATSIADADWPRGWPREGAPVQRTIQFEDACACYRTGREWCRPPTDFFAPPLPPNGVIDGSIDLASGPLTEDPENFTVDFFAFTQAVCGKHIPDDAYGTAGDIIKLKCTATRSFIQAKTATQELTELILRNVPSLIGVGSIAGDEELATKLFNVYMSTQVQGDAAAMWQRLEARHVALKSAWSAAQLLEARVEKHIERRRTSGCQFLQNLCDDTLASVARYLPSAAASAMVRSCKDFNQVEVLRDAMPHFRIRHVQGAFPHKRRSSRDRADLARKVNKPVMRNFVVTRNAVRLYVDFIVRTTRVKPLKKLPRKDGLCNESADFSDDEFETPPERSVHRGPHALPFTGALTTWAQRQRHSRDQRRRAAWEQADGPAEKIDRYAYDQRLQYSDFFRAPPMMIPSLVFADDNTPVPCSMFKGGLSLCSSTRVRGGMFSQPRSEDVQFEVDYQLPASTRFHVPHLSRDHGNRLFKIKIVANGLFLNGETFQTTFYSEPFESVGKMQTVQQAGKRSVAAPAQPQAAKSQRR